MAPHSEKRARGPGVLTAPPLPQEYEQASKVDQFVTRFLLRETVSQLQALQSSLEGASDTLEAQAQAQARGPWYVRSPAACGPPREHPLAPHSQSLSSNCILEFQWPGAPVLFV